MYLQDFYRKQKMSTTEQLGQPIDVEAFAKNDKPIPPGHEHGYLIRIDGEDYVVYSHTITGRELLTLAGKMPPERYRLDQKLKGGATRKIGLDEAVDLTSPGVERFMTLPLDQTAG